MNTPASKHEEYFRKVEERFDEFYKTSFFSSFHPHPNFFSFKRFSKKRFRNTVRAFSNEQLKLLVDFIPLTLTLNPANTTVADNASKATCAEVFATQRLTRLDFDGFSLLRALRTQFERLERPVTKKDQLEILSFQLQNERDLVGAQNGHLQLDQAVVKYLFEYSVTNGLKSHREIFVLKQTYACYLVEDCGVGKVEAAKLSKLSSQQVSRALAKHRSGMLSMDLVDRRGTFMKNVSSRMGQIALRVHNKALSLERKFTVADIRAEVMSSDLVVDLSQSFVRSSMLRGGFKFGHKRLISSVKNSTETKNYRAWFSYELIQALAAGKLIVSIDETGFSNYNNFESIWFHPNKITPQNFPTETDTSSMSLLLAVSQTGVEGFYVVCGSINEIIFLDFLRQLELSLKNKNVALQNVVLTMDNARIHQSKLVRAFLVKKRLHTMFSPPYSPEVNFVENVFNKLKSTYRKKACQQTKWPNQDGEDAAGSQFSAPNFDRRRSLRPKAALDQPPEVAPTTRHGVTINVEST